MFSIYSQVGYHSTERILHKLLGENVITSLFHVQWRYNFTIAQVVVAHAFNPSALEAEEGGSLNLTPV